MTTLCPYRVDFLCARQWRRGSRYYPGRYIRKYCSRSFHVNYFFGFRKQIKMIRLPESIQEAIEVKCYADRS